jgi:DSF synthase
MNAVVEFPTLSTISKYTQLELEYDSELKTLFSWMKPSPRPCFTADLLEEVQRYEKLLEANQGHINDCGRPERVDFLVAGSRVPGVFNLGGDLSMLIQAIMRQDRKMLSFYAHLCVENIHRRLTGFGAQISTISLVQGKALGGGFECALVADVIVAERSATMSLPEVLFNLFPGMGALSLLARRCGLRKAEEIIMSGQVFTAKEMYEIGVVDELVEDGLGLESARRLIQSRRRKHNSYRALHSAKQYYQPITIQELTGIADVWVDAALQLETRDLRMMARLVKAQDRLVTTSSDDEAVESLFATSTGQAVANA